MAKADPTSGWFRISVPGQPQTSWHYCSGDFRVLRKVTAGQRTVFTPKAICGYVATTAGATAAWWASLPGSAEPRCQDCLSHR